MNGESAPKGPLTRLEPDDHYGQSAPESFARSEEHTSELHHDQISYAVFCLKKKKTGWPKIHTSGTRPTTPTLTQLQRAMRPSASPSKAPARTPPSYPQQTTPTNNYYTLRLYR